jgi:serine/threonine protein kinase
LLKSIGKYKVKGLIARGARSQVYLAQDPHLSVQLAIKVFDCQLFDNQNSDASVEQHKIKNWQADFISESKILHQLSSAPHVVSFMEFDFTDTKQPYIVMPYYKRSLADLLGSQNKLSMHKTLLIAQQILTGLRYIHEAGLVHLDIKPANVLLDDNDQVQIADFGTSISKVTPAIKHASNLFKRGIGSLYYASPEQLIDAQNSTTKSDIYAVSALMYRCLTGGHYSEIKQPVNIVNPNIDHEVSQVIELGLSSEPKQRPASAKQMALTIENILAKCATQIYASGREQSDDPEATRVWESHSTINSNVNKTDNNRIKALELSIQQTLLKQGEINEFDFTRFALLAEAELHQQYSPQWLAQYIAQIQSQLARQDNKAATLFLWIEQVNRAISSATIDNKCSLTDADQKKLIALGKSTLNIPAQELASIIECKLLGRNTQHSPANQTTRNRARGRFVCAVIIIACALIIPWWLQSFKTSGSSLGNAELTDIDGYAGEQEQLLASLLKDDTRQPKNSQENVINDISEIQIKDSLAVDIPISNIDVILQIQPQDADVVLQSMQGIPVSNSSVKQGEYWLRVSKNGYRTVTKKIDITSNTYIINEELELSDSRYFIGNTDKTVADGIAVEFILLPVIPSTLQNLDAKATKAAYSRIRIMSFEVTNQLYGACVDAGKCATSKTLSTDPRYRTFSLPEHPAMNVSWFDVNEQFIPWLAEQTATRLRLPTKVEWEFAAAASLDNTAKKYSWGARMQLNKAHCKNCNVSNEVSVNTTMPVQSFAPNDWQIFDMHGNIQEWTSTCPKPYIAKASHSTLQPRCDLAVVKGGSWLSDTNQLAISEDDFLNKTIKSHTTGFRLVEEIHE